jgi:hypothetical protein
MTFQAGPGTEPLLTRFAGFSKGEPCLLAELLCSEDEAGLVRPQVSNGLSCRTRLVPVRRLLVASSVVSEIDGVDVSGSVIRVIGILSCAED